MAAQVVREPEFRLRAFTEFALLPGLLRTPRGEWASILERRSANLDHVEDGDLPDPDDPYGHLAEDAWGLCRFLGLVSDGGLTADGLALRDVAAPGKAVKERIADRIENWRTGPEGIRVVTVLELACKELGQVGETLSGVLPGLLLGEMTLLLEAGRRGSEATATAIGRLGRIRYDVDGDTPDLDGLSGIGRKVVTANEVNALALDSARALAGGSGGEVTLTEARATAMLLFHSGLFADVSPLGPVNCLAPPGAVDPTPVLDRHGQVGEWGIDSEAAAMLMMCLHEHSFTRNEALVFRALGLRRQPRLSSSGEPLDISQRRAMNKALAMEMLCAILLSRIDGAKAVFAQWLTEGARPIGAAPAGFADIEATYPELPGGGKFEVLAEVSAKREVTPSFFRKQLNQALAHGRNAQGERGGTVYALVVNGGRIAFDPELQAEYHRFLDENDLRPDGPVRVVPISAIDLAGTVSNLEMNSPGSALNIAPEELAAGFDELLDGLYGTVPDDPEWMFEVLRNAANAEPRLELYSQDGLDDDLESGGLGIG